MNRHQYRTLIIFAICQHGLQLHGNFLIFLLGHVNLILKNK